VKTLVGISLLVVLLAVEIAWSPVATATSLARPDDSLLARAVALNHPPASVMTTCPSPYMVRKGDTLTAIAARCGTNMTNLRRWNRLSSNRVRVGQVLITHGLSARPAAAPARGSKPIGMAPKPTPRIEPIILP
jgi:LysM repeat protein